MVLIAFVVIIVYPVVWMIFASFKSPTEIVTNIWGLPTVWHWENYTSAWENASMGYAHLQQHRQLLGYRGAGGASWRPSPATPLPSSASATRS